jgi:hypothetical protein
MLTLPLIRQPWGQSEWQGKSFVFYGYIRLGGIRWVRPTHRVCVADTVALAGIL